MEIIDDIRSPKGAKPKRRSLSGLDLIEALASVFGKNLRGQLADANQFLSVNPYIRGLTLHPAGGLMNQNP